MDFLERLESLSREKNIGNNYKLAELSGVPYTTIDNFYRKGYDNVKLSTIRKLAMFFDCSLDYLIGISDIRVETKKAPAITGEDSNDDTHIKNKLVADLTRKMERFDEVQLNAFENMIDSLTPPHKG